MLGHENSNSTLSFCTQECFVGNMSKCNKFYMIKNYLRFISTMNFIISTSMQPLSSALYVCICYLI